MQSASSWYSCVYKPDDNLHLLYILGRWIPWSHLYSFHSFFSVYWVSMTPIIEWLSGSSCHQRRLFSYQGSATCEGLLFIWICTHNNLRLLYIQGGWSPQCQSIFWHDRLWNPQFMVRDWYLSRICWCQWRANILYQLLAGSRPFSSNLSDFPPFSQSDVRDFPDVPG